MADEKIEKKIILLGIDYNSMITIVDFILIT